MIEAEAFLDAGDRDHTASLLGDDFATNMRAQETFEAEKRLLQVPPSFHLDFSCCRDNSFCSVSPKLT